jgi:hypothetical protein
VARSVYVYVMEGLGNQLFQYATGRAMARRTGLPLLLNTSWFTHPQRAHRPYGLGFFPIAAEVATPRQLLGLPQDDAGRRFGLLSLDEIVETVREPNLLYWPDLIAKRGPMYLIGYWQHVRYFEEYGDAIRRELAFPPLPAEAQPLAERIAGQPNSVVVHVRRGDYFDPRYAQLFTGCCSPEYYRAAIKLVANKVGPLSLFVFSDEPEWVRANFDPLGHEMEVVDNPAHVAAPHHDMHLMTLGRHHIIANSTFSWWGAWLSRSVMVIAPGRWLAGPPPDFGTFGRYPASWVLV